MDGTYEQIDSWAGMPEGEVVIGPMNDAITAGEYHPFTGPINKQDGSAWLAEGETADDGTLLGMNFYIEGITGDIPN
jgi:simple sugar transport system substrate-binding protein